VAKLWNRDGEAFQTRDGELMPVSRAQRLGFETRRPFDNGVARLHDGELFPDDEGDDDA